MRPLYGVPSLLLSDVVANFMIEQGNSNQSHYPANLVRAARTWEDLMLDTIFQIKYRAVPVNKKNMTIRLPKDCIRMFNVSVVDKCGLMVPLAANPEFNTLKIDCPADCSCSSCDGKNTLCVALDAVSVVTSTVMLNGYPFTMRTWTQKGPGGLLQQVTEIPYPQLPYPMSGPPTVDYKTEVKTLCNLDVTDTNCIKPTEANKQLLKTHCGCTIPTWHHEMCCNDRQYPRSNYGEWNWLANSGDTIVVKDTTADFFIVCYQSSGDCSGDEVLVPRPALDAIQYSIVHRQKAWNPGATQGDKVRAEMAYEKYKDKLFAFLHPVDPVAFGLLRDIIMKW